MNSKTKPDKLAYDLDEISRIAKLDPKIINSWKKNSTS